jgi:hypothetical protein
MKKVYYHDMDLALNQLLRPLLENLASDPAGTKSRFYYNTTSNKVKYFNGNAWVSFIDSTDPRLTDSRVPSIHLIADAAGLGKEHTISGGVVGAVLRVISNNNARIEKLFHGDLLDKGTHTHNQIDAHLLDTTRHFLINDSGNAANEVFSASKVLELISFVSQAATGALTFIGSYDPVLNSPNITGGLTVKKGHTYVIAVEGNFYGTKAVKAGDMIIAQEDNANSLSKWLVINKDIPAMPDASTTTKGIIKIATATDITQGTNETTAVTPKQLKLKAEQFAENKVTATSIPLSALGANSFYDNIPELLATYLNENPVTIDEVSIPLFEIVNDYQGIMLLDAAAMPDPVFRQVYSLKDLGKGTTSGLTAASVFLISTDLRQDLENIFALTGHTHTAGEVESDPNKVDKVTSSGKERVYVINPDGTQSVKNIEDISQDGKLDADFSSLIEGDLPLSGDELVAINQDGVPKFIPVSEIKNSTNILSESFIYSSGAQEFVTRYRIGQMLVVFVNGQQINDYTYTTTSVTINNTSAIAPGSTVSILYVEELIGVSLYYTKAEVNGLIKKKTIELTFKLSGNVEKDLSFESLGMRFLAEAYSLKKATVVFEEATIDVNKIIPIQVKLSNTHTNAINTSVVETLNCSMISGTIYNATYMFNIDKTMGLYTMLSVTAGNFISGAQVVKNCWVTLTLEQQ